MERWSFGTGRIGACWLGSCGFRCSVSGVVFELWMIEEL